VLVAWLALEIPKRIITDTDEFSGKQMLGKAGSRNLKNGTFIQIV